MPDGGWALTVLYSNPDQGMHFTVYYTLGSPGSEPVFEFVSEITPSEIVSSQHMYNVVHTHPFVDALAYCYYGSHEAPTTLAPMIGHVQPFVYIDYHMNIRTNSSLSILLQFHIFWSCHLSML